MLNTPLDSTCLLTKRSNDIIYENFRRKEHRVSILPFPLQRQDYAELCALINILCLLLSIIGPVSSSFVISVSSRSAMTKKKKKKKSTRTSWKEIDASYRTAARFYLSAKLAFQTNLISHRSWYILGKSQYISYRYLIMNLNRTMAFRP